MLKKRNLWFILIIILVLALLFYFFYYKGKDKNTSEKEEKIEEVEEEIIVDEAPVKIEKGSVIGVKEGKKEWEIKADKISLGKDRKDTIFEYIEKIIIFKDEQLSLNITADKCVAEMDNNNMELSGNVIIETKEGDTIKGDKFFWNAEEKILTSRSSVKIKTKDNNITANVLSTDAELNELKLKGNVKVAFKIE